MTPDQDMVADGLGASALALKAVQRFQTSLSILAAGAMPDHEHVRATILVLAAALRGAAGNLEAAVGRSDERRRRADEEGDR